MTQEQQGLIWLAHAKLSPKTVEHLLSVYGSAEALLNNNSLVFEQNCTPKQAQLLRQSLEELPIVLQQMKNLGVELLTKQDAAYPQRLRELADAPYALFYKGNVDCLQKNCIAVVGTRKPSFYGQKVAKELAQNFAKQNINVVSGFAMGIDTCAHEAASEYGTTCAVCGCGFAINYPQSNAKLKQQILNNGGLIMSEYSPYTPPLSYHFPFRNRIIAALSQMVFFVEGANKSGGMLTVEKAIELGKSVYAVPGNIYNLLSEGPNSLIALGQAKCYYDFAQALEELNIKEPQLQVQEIYATNIENELSGLQLEVYRVLKQSERSFDELVYICKQPPDMVQVAVGYLEIMDYIQNTGGNIYQLK